MASTRTTSRNQIDKALAQHIATRRAIRLDNSIIRLIAVLAGTASIFLGYLLFIKGVTGEASIVVNSSSISGQLINAAPGLFFAISGVVIISVSLVVREKLEHIQIVRRNGANEEVISTPASRCVAPERKPTDDEEDSDADLAYLDIPAFLRRQAD